MKSVLSIALAFGLLLLACTGSLEAPRYEPQPQPVAMLGLSDFCKLPIVPLGSSEPLGYSPEQDSHTPVALGRSAVPPVLEEIPPEERVSAITPSLGHSIAVKREQNADSVGWLVVPDTTIDTVIVKNPEGDNNYYTTHSFYRAVDQNGAYGADFRCELQNASRGTMQRNTTLYAHNFTEDPDGALFAQLKKYKDPEFARTHPYIFFSTPNEDMAWEVFAVYDSNTDMPYIVPDLSWDIYSRILDVASDASIYDYGITITEEDRILTLSTCSFVVPGRDPIPLNVSTRYRFVVQARLVGPDEPIKDSVRITENLDPLPPDRMPPIYHPGLDVFMYGGAIYATDPRWELEVDFTGAVEVGEIARTGISYDLEDSDATSLPVGSKIWGYAQWDEMLAVEKDGERVAYIKYWQPEA